MTAWNAETVAGASELGAVTIVEGSSFCISSHSGDIFPGAAQGVFYQDTRVISQWILLINGVRREPLVAHTRDLPRHVRRPGQLAGWTVRQPVGSGAAAPRRPWSAG